MKRMVAVLLMSLWSCVGNAQKDMDSGNFILRFCKELAANVPVGRLTNPQMSGVCMGEIVGISVVGHLITGESKFCRPKQATRNQALLVVVHFMESHPNMLHYDFESLILLALQDAWPCKN